MEKNASGESLRVAGTDITDEIVRHFRKAYNLAIGEYAWTS